jgi:hypothetical protein
MDLLSKILRILDSRKTHQELAKNGITPLDRGVNIFKVVIIALFFDLEISYTVSGLLRNKQLKKQLKIDEIYNENQIYEFLSRFDATQFNELPKIFDFCNYENL